MIENGSADQRSVRHVWVHHASYSCINKAAKIEFAESMLYFY